MSHKKITAFPDGNSYVHYNPTSDRLLIGNSEGLIKLFNIAEPELEPVSIDIIDNLTSLAHDSDSNRAVVTSTSGQLELIDLKSGESNGIIHRSDLPLRDAVFVNSGKRVVCGGDDDKLVVVDVQDKSTQSITLPDQMVNLAYNFSGEIISVCLSNGNVQLYSVVNEQPNLIHSLNNVLNAKINTSLDQIDFNQENHDELVCSKTHWSSNGRYLLVPTIENEVHVYQRDDWKIIKKFDNDNAKIVDFALSANGKHLVILSHDGFKIFDFDSGNVIHEDTVDFDGYYPLNTAWRGNHLFIGTTNGEVLSLKNIVSESASNLFVDEAEESDIEDDEGEKDDGNDTDVLLRDSDDENEEPALARKREYKLHEEDELIIDEDDEELNGLSNGHSESYKRSKLNGHSTSNGHAHVPTFEIKPYSPGSTPFNHGSVKKRYLTMNNLGYVWIVKTIELESQQSITVSFFDRSVHREYNFIDYSGFDLASLNARGILLARSADSKKEGGLVYYRDHDDSYSWERKIPLVVNEYITSVCISNSNSENDLIVVGTNMGYLRVFDQFGLCVNVIKTTPVVSLISSSRATLFMINQVANVFTYSIIELADFKYYQQNVMLPLKHSDKLLIKGVFFNEYDDPILVGGEDDTVLVLHQWRQEQNSKWIPLLNCHDAIVGHNRNKKNWKCWPLGLIGEKLNCLILKGGDSEYPGFPLPLPVEIDIEMPIVVKERAKEKKKSDLDDLGLGEGDDDDEEDEEETRVEEDAEEVFVRSTTFGKLLSETLNDENTEDTDRSDIMERLNECANLFDKSLLKLFGQACSQSQLNKAWSIVKMIKKDKAQYAAFRIAERMQFMNLANKIRELREMSLEEEEDD
ncbi:uncharacterized protein SPAPADRAFT_52025 [Spathaspora passalidarum NRRL Y-27907]|uniref:Uncharacterized protein n=1 Tax=Spathaspora passalidarum (strain NRRL Y-27907 / 11-Y1) TaxID=619300 RepID=G3AT64_SPAPN|nr:uncharacterized protein SPAPADRAFT_52025 [Spathaspora passalidarum NRRL Y-27907]EGW30827.1 hypothetical protein SPAPADRAFT_52025 [Spathaspora passalidarum NRRL Y-27907]